MKEVKIGQIWREVDPRFEADQLAKKVVVGFTHDGRVVTRTLREKNVRTTVAKRERFNGQSGGYELLEDTP